MINAATQLPPLCTIGDTIYGDTIKPFIVGEIRPHDRTYKYIKKNGRINLLEPEVKIPLYREGNICLSKEGELFCLESFTVTDRGEVLHKGQRYTENMYPYARTKNVWCLESDIVHMPLQNIRGKLQFYGLQEIALLASKAGDDLTTTLLRSLVGKVRASPIKYSRNK